MEDMNMREMETKKEDPYRRANILSKIFFVYLIPLFHKGFNNVLSDEDILPSQKENDSSFLGNKLEQEWDKQLKNEVPSLWKALATVFGSSLIISGLWYMFIELIVRLAQPLSLFKLLNYYEPNPTVTKNEAYVYSSLIVASAAISMISQHQFMLYQFIIGVRIRVCTSGLVYRKALKLCRSSLTETNVGQMVNLISNDVARFESSIKHVHNIWLAPLEIVVILVLLYFYVGPSGMMGVIFLMAFIPFQMWFGKKTSIYRLNTAIKTDERIRLMNEIISGIQVIKLYTWEKPFAKLVALSRRKEMDNIRKTSVVRAAIMSFQLFINQVAIFLCILVYILTGNVINAQYVYVITSFYNIFRVVITKRFPEGATQIAETGISVRRIREFLLRDEIRIDNNKNQSTPVDKVIVMENACLKWNVNLNDYSLEKVNLEVYPKELVVIIGSVGSGKTTLLHGILGELSPLSGNLRVYGKISYASQEPFLFLGSIKQNILFNQQFHFKKYTEVVKVCGLEKDFLLFPHGDRTLVGERGVTLSGGQKARINLARAVYRDADIYLLDDPLSAVDTHVGRQIYEECIEKYLKEKCVVLVTHQLQYLKSVKKVILLENGKIEFIGSFEELQKTTNQFAKLFNENYEETIGNANDSDDGYKERHDKDIYVEKSKTGQHEHEDPKLVQESRASGKIDSDLYKIYLGFGGNRCVVFSIISVFLFAQLLSSTSDYYLSWWVNAETIKASQDATNTNLSHTALSVTSVVRNVEQLSALEQFWLQYMTDNISLIIYSLILVVLIVVAVSRSVFFFYFCVNASINMHNIMFDKIVHAALRFFNSNPSGRILNRFSRDMNQVDEILPSTMIDTLQDGLTVLFTTIVVASVNPWMLIPTAVMLIIFYLLRQIYMATSRDIKRIESTTRSPVYTHLSTTLQGLTTIRAFGVQKIFCEQFDQYQNQNSAAFITFIAIGRCFGLWLDLNCVVYIFFVTMSFLFFDTGILGGFVGLSITQALTLTGKFQWCMRQWTELENAMTCVERIKEYIDIDPERDECAKETPRDWPSKGNISFKGLNMKYSPDGPFILKHLTFEIEPKQKVGIVGRTGAGKSSIINALFRLAENEGEIVIDGVDINTIALEKLRSSISIIPQEPVLFTGTLRKNLDPFDEYGDEVLWKALEDVELKDTFTEQPQGLESKISEGGSNYSVGQRQLVCLARAITRNNKILVLDEATANVDPQTDALIQQTIRKNFSDCTVLTIAHRLHTIMDSDKVLVMDAGQVVEFGSAFDLLQDANGVFTGMVEETGKATAAYLFSIAQTVKSKIELNGN